MIHRTILKACVIILGPILCLNSCSSSATDPNANRQESFFRSWGFNSPKPYGYAISRGPNATIDWDMAPNDSTWFTFGFGTIPKEWDHIPSHFQPYRDVQFHVVDSTLPEGLQLNFVPNTKPDSLGFYTFMIDNRGGAPANTPLSIRIEAIRPGSTPAPLRLNLTIYTSAYLSADSVYVHPGDSATIYVTMVNLDRTKKAWLTILPTFPSPPIESETLSKGGILTKDQLSFPIHFTVNPDARPGKYGLHLKLDIEGIIDDIDLSPGIIVL